MDRPKRLDEVARNPHDNVGTYAKYALCLEQRIEELEREKDALMGVCKCPSIHITTDQIDAAVERISHWTDSATEAGWALLVMLFGVKRCVWCREEHKGVFVDEEGEFLHCPKCHGHGWVKEVP